eukprot:1158817-Pelagomonas_calceolata.AAC.2
MSLQTASVSHPFVTHAHIPVISNRREITQMRSRAAGERLQGETWERRHQSQIKAFKKGGRLALGT